MTKKPKDIYNATLKECKNLCKTKRRHYWNKTFDKLCRTKRRHYWNKTFEKINNSLNDSKEFWKTWKQSSETNDSINTEPPISGKSLYSVKDTII